MKYFVTLTRKPTQRNESPVIASMHAAIIFKHTLKRIYIQNSIAHVKTYLYSKQYYLYSKQYFVKKQLKSY